jgi:hypothetical protein
MIDEEFRAEHIGISAMTRRFWSSDISPAQIEMAAAAKEAFERSV